MSSLLAQRKNFIDSLIEVRHIVFLLSDVFSSLTEFLQAPPVMSFAEICDRAGYKIESRLFTREIFVFLLVT